MNAPTVDLIHLELLLPRLGSNRGVCRLLPIMISVLFSSSILAAAAQEARKITPVEAMEAGSKWFAAGKSEKAIVQWTEAVIAFQAAGNV